ncbi:MAG: hypothetical protein IPO08_22385 [Xanthomonadales bacterium]|nr:hypothetical protein [Xanthomonadales bacterium]
MSKLSVHIGNEPTGLQDFERIAKPAVIYSINNTVTPVNRETITIRRVQNDKWHRLPDAMGQPNYFKPVAQGGIDPIVAARNELLLKKMYVPKRGNLNLIEFWKLGRADYYAPYNEPVLGDSVDHIAKAQWLNDYTCEALTIARVYGLHLSIFSFASGNPHPDTLPHLAPAASLCAAYGGIIDVHEYGIDGPLMSARSSGAFGYRRLIEAFDECPPIVVSEAGAGGGYNTSLRGAAWVATWHVAVRLMPRGVWCWARVLSNSIKARSLALITAR